MSNVTILRKQYSPSGTKDKVTMSASCLVTGEASEGLAITALTDEFSNGYNLPPHGLLTLDSWEVDEKRTDDGFYFNLSFSAPINTITPEEEEEEFTLPDPTVSFNIATYTVNMTHSLQTLEKVGDQRDLDGAINWDREGIEGIDVEVAMLIRVETHIVYTQIFGPSYVNNLISIVKQINNAEFRGYQAGEVKFDNFSLSPKDDLTSTLVLTFHIVKNETNITKGDYTVLKKDGFDYIWFMSEDRIDEGGAQPLKRPKITGVRVEKIKERVSFSTLQVGVNEFGVE